MHYLIPILIYPLLDLLVVSVVRVLLSVELLWEVLSGYRMVV